MTGQLGTLADIDLDGLAVTYDSAAVDLRYAADQLQVVARAIRDERLQFAQGALVRAFDGIERGLESLDMEEEGGEE